MIFRRRTRSRDVAFLALIVALSSNVSRGTEPASGDRPAPENSAAKPVRKNVKLPVPRRGPAQGNGELAHARL